MDSFNGLCETGWSLICGYEPEVPQLHTNNLLHPVSLDEIYITSDSYSCMPSNNSDLLRQKPAFTPPYRRYDHFSVSFFFPFLSDAIDQMKEELKENIFPILLLQENAFCWFSRKFHRNIHICVGKRQFCVEKRIPTWDENTMIKNNV